MPWVVRPGGIRAWIGPRPADPEFRPEDQRVTTEHGSMAGYYRHRKLKEPACDECRAARLAHDRAEKRDKRWACPHCGASIAHTSPQCRSCAAKRSNAARGRGDKALLLGNATVE